MLKRTVGAYRSSPSRGGSRCLIIFHPPIFRLLFSHYMKIESTLSFFHFRILFQNPSSMFVSLVCRLLCGFLFVYIQSLHDSVRFPVLFCLTILLDVRYTNCFPFPVLVRLV